MDITLVRTFLEVAATGSFVNAADRLFVTQSAVSLRIQRLETSLGRPLFTRSKAGAELTSAGRAFESYAISLLKVWEEARQQIAIPEGFSASLSIGAQYSLWPRLGFQWVDHLRAARSDLNIRAELGMPDRLTRFLIEGVIQAALLYNPQMRPGLSVTKVLDEELVMVAAWPDADYETDLAGRYAFVDWGPEFVQAHALHLPDLVNPGLTLALGAQSAQYLMTRGLSGYLPAGYAQSYLESGALHLVPDAPVFPYPVWAVFREDLDPKTAAVARETLTQCAEIAQRAKQQVLNDLVSISEDTLERLGEPDDQDP